MAVSSRLMAFTNNKKQKNNKNNIKNIDKNRGKEMGKGRSPCCDKDQVKKGPWSPTEDMRLITYIQKHGHHNWRALPKQAGLTRCGKSCRLRWVNYLRPDLKRGNFTTEEEEAIISLHHSLGNKWSRIAAHLPGRTDNEIKNVWNTHLKKRLPAKDSSSSSSSEQATHHSCDDISGKNESFPSSSSSSSNSSAKEGIEVWKEEGSSPSSPFTGCEIPLEFDSDFWNMLENLGGEGESGGEEGELVCGEDRKKWLEYIEMELGLEPGEDQVLLESDEEYNHLVPIF